MSVIQKALELFPDTDASDWRIVGKAAVHRTVIPGKACEFYGPAIVRGGVFRGGEFYGGQFHGGVFRGGVFRGGVFRGGVFRGGQFRGGVFRGGVFRGGVFRGGQFRGGVFRGGVFRGGVFDAGMFHGGDFFAGQFHGGVFRGGQFHGGVFRGGQFHGGDFFAGQFKTTPLQLFEVLPWPVVRQANGCLAIGCECHTVADWLADLGAIAQRHHVTAALQAEVARVLREFEPGGLFVKEHP